MTDSTTTRRLVDVIVGFTLAVISLPILLVALAVSAVTIGASPLFVQDRIGRRGERFRFPKIRTLPLSVAPYVAKTELDHEDIPGAANLLRRLHIDELPQLWLVVTGQMSLVGPRPEMPTLHAELPRDFAALRTSVKPGCTGLWQIGPHCTGLIAESPQYDTLYLEQRSWRLDLWILLHTARKMLTVSTVDLDRIPRWALRPTTAAPRVEQPVLASD